MNQKVKIVLITAGCMLLYFLAFVAYDYLSERVEPGNGDGSEQGEVFGLYAVNKEAADFTMVDWDGNEVRLSDMRGRPVVLNFWASWCPPCKREMPDFETVYKELGGEVQFIMLDLVDGMRETKDKGIQYIEEQGYTFPVFFDTKQEADRAYEIRSIPATYFINKDGFIITKAQGAINEKTLRKGIDSIR